MTTLISIPAPKWLGDDAFLLASKDGAELAKAHLRFVDNEEDVALVTGLKPERPAGPWRFDHAACAKHGAC
jgi:hypothetical protein